MADHRRPDQLLEDRLRIRNGRRRDARGPRCENTRSARVAPKGKKGVGNGEWGNFPYYILHFSFVIAALRAVPPMKNDKRNTEKGKFPYSPLPTPHSPFPSYLSI